MALIAAALPAVAVAFLQSIFLGPELQEEYVPSALQTACTFVSLLQQTTTNIQTRLWCISPIQSDIGVNSNVYVNITRKPHSTTTHTKCCSMDLGSYVGAPTEKRLGFSGPIIVSMSLESSLRIVLFYAE